MLPLARWGEGTGLFESLKIWVFECQEYDDLGYIKEVKTEEVKLDSLKM